ncbi:hypothetical protein A5893_12405 [Pedobacter psychrophilus]|uniref:Deoxyribose-phosphate aldolase n=1 Tax=Pedobacter psychrophilus TaxID=1826909 RepID=A0A179DDR6_9SPHI|nr:DUF6503 family protein [Pedobacter psychrophilus]OAQ38840.1 hypothetical protein A5893_12405 [Pedobacter psychrophilus]
MQKNQFFLSVIIASLGFSACNLKPSPQKIVDKSIHFYGMDELDNKVLEFDFRQSHFSIDLNDKDWFYQRSFTDSVLGKVKDQLSSRGFVREVNGLINPLSNKDSLKYAESVNSVAYFALLPLKLNDEAVEKKYLKSVMVNGKAYDEIEVSFKKENGGSHYDDKFYFWFDALDHSMDYFAYSKGGNRFRAIDGLQKVGDKYYFQNYDNFEYKGKEKLPLSDYHILFEQDKLTKLSEIKLENIKVK